MITNILVKLQTYRVYLRECYQLDLKRDGEELNRYRHIADLRGDYQLSLSVLTECNRGGICTVIECGARVILIAT